MDTLTDKRKKSILRDEHGRILPGSGPVNPLGKKDGCRHKATQIKMAFFEAFEKIGGMEGLIKWINESKLNKREFYKMILNIMPREMDVTNDSEDMKLIIIRSSEKITVYTKDTLTLVASTNNPPPKL